MKLQHNLGGLEGLGPVNFEKRVFVAPWEKHIFGIHVAMMGLSNHLDLSKDPRSKFKSGWTWADLRKGAEAMNPFDYFKYRYYEKWLGGISGFFVDAGYVTAEELEERTKKYREDPDAPLPTGGDPAIDEQVIEYLRVGDSPKRDVDLTPKFRVGDTVRVKNVPPDAHTRLPGHTRGKIGVIDVVYPGFYTYFCSTGEDGLGEPMPVYCVRFDPKEIWRTRAEENETVYADLFETYLEAA